MKRKNIFHITLMSLVTAGLMCSCDNGVNKTGPLTWKFKDGTLTISGQGVMPNYDIAPWDKHKVDITNVLIEYGIENVGNKAFSGLMSLRKIEIPSSILSIGDYAFQGCIGLTSITIPSTLTIGDYAFEGCVGLTSVDFPFNVTSIGKFAFANCRNLTSISIPFYLEVIKESTFEGCENLTSVFIPDRVFSIERNAFANCERLERIRLGERVSFIGVGAFKMCRRISRISSYNSVPPKIEIGKDDMPISSERTIVVVAGDVHKNAFTHIPKNIPVSVPSGSISAYKNAPVWEKFTNFDTKLLFVTVTAGTLE